MDLGDGTLGIAKAVQLALLLVSLPFERSDVGPERRKLTRRRDVLADRTYELHDHERNDEQYDRRSHSATGGDEHGTSTR
ncbi:MAG: hypothetical protein WBE59_12705 [Candidatus Cybelea sp.]